MDWLHFVLTGGIGLVGFFLKEERSLGKEKHDELKDIVDEQGKQIVELQRRASVNDESNKNRDNKIESMDKKLDRLLEKLGA